MAMYRTIVVGTDGSVTARGAVKHAAQLAVLTGAQLHLVCAQTPAPAVVVPEVGLLAADAEGRVAADIAATLEEAKGEVEAMGATVREVHSPCGPVAACLVEVATSVGADLLVVGSRGMHGVRRVMGSVPNSVSHHAPCHVLLVHTA
jgi:nucleotide-binding universal stress UspA family protein